MPLYEYECKKCGAITEAFYPMAEKLQKVVCDQCGYLARAIISIGGIQGDEPPWINDDLRGCLQKPGERPITNRTEYKAYLRQNNLVERG